MFEGMFSDVAAHTFLDTSFLDVAQINTEVLPGVGVGYLSLVPLKYFLIFPCSQKSKSLFSIFPAPRNYLCSPVPFIFRLVFSCFPEINDIIPLFPRTPGRASTLV